MKTIDNFIEDKSLFYNIKKQYLVMNLLGIIQMK
jgi:hypothetical protein